MTNRKDDPPVVIEDDVPPVEAYQPPEEEHPEDDTRNYIMYRIPYMEGNVQKVHEHRIPMEDREKFEKEHGL